MDQDDRNSEDSLHEDLLYSADPENEEPFGYNSVPLEILGSIKVKYKFVGKLKPMPYDWSD